MKKSFFRRIGLFLLITMTFLMAMAHRTDNSNASVPEHVSGYSNHVNNQNNWGLFGIIGAIALVGLTKRNVVQKN